MADEGGESLFLAPFVHRFGVLIAVHHHEVGASALILESVGVLVPPPLDVVHFPFGWMHQGVRPTMLSEVRPKSNRVSVRLGTSETIRTLRPHFTVKCTVVRPPRSVRHPLVAMTLRDGMRTQQLGFLWPPIPGRSPSFPAPAPPISQGRWWLQCRDPMPFAGLDAANNVSSQPLRREGRCVVHVQHQTDLMLLSPSVSTVWAAKPHAQPASPQHRRLPPEHRVHPRRP